jgi:hypothetical protein
MRCPDTLLSELGMTDEQAAEAFAPRFGMTASIDAVRGAVQAAKDTKQAWDAAVEAAKSAYGFAKTHPAWIDADGKVTDGYLPAIAPHIKGIERAMALGAAPPIAWGRDLQWLYARASEAARGVAATLGPGQGVGIDELISAAGGEQRAGLAGFGLAGFGLAGFGLAPVGEEPGKAEEPERPEETQAEWAERAQWAEAERPEEPERPQWAEAGQEARHGLEQLAAADGLTEADGGSWWRKLSAAVTEAGRRLSYARTFVWRTIKAVARIAFPIALLATVVFAVLFACCTMLTNDSDSEISVCTFVRTICSPKPDPVKFIADVSKLSGPQFQKAMAMAEMQRRATGANAAGAAKILSSIAFPAELKQEYLKYAFTDDLEIAKDDRSIWEMFKGMLGWYSPTAAQAIQDAGNKVDRNYLSVIQKLYECSKIGVVAKRNAAIADLVKDHTVADYIDRVFHTKTEHLRLDSYGNWDTQILNGLTERLKAIMNGETHAAHRAFIGEMHKFAWHQFTPLASVFGRAQGGALRLVGDALGLNDNFADKAAGWGAALVALEMAPSPPPPGRSEMPGGNFLSGSGSLILRADSSRFSQSSSSPSSPSFFSVGSASATDTAGSEDDAAETALAGAVAGSGSALGNRRMNST